MLCKDTACAIILSMSILPKHLSLLKQDLTVIHVALKLWSSCPSLPHTENSCATTPGNLNIEAGSSLSIIFLSDGVKISSFQKKKKGYCHLGNFFLCTVRVQYLNDLRSNIHGLMFQEEIDDSAYHRSLA